MGRKRKPSLDPTRAVAYVRVSTEEQHLGPEAQREALLYYAELRGLTISSWHVDQGVSGGTTAEDRPGLTAALSALTAENCGVLLIAKRDRLARDVGIAIATTRIVENLGARIESTDGSNEDTAQGKFMRTMIDSMAEYEREMIKNRTKSALAVKKRRGEKLGGPPPFGFRAERVTVESPLKLVEDAQEQEIVARIRDLATTKSPAIIAKQLNAEGVPARGSRWHPTTIARILTREA